MREIKLGRKNWDWSRALSRMCRVFPISTLSFQQIHISITPKSSPLTFDMAVNMHHEAGMALTTTRVATQIERLTAELAGLEEISLSMH
jgi:hypothetical protein